MKILITGARGFVGGATIQHIETMIGDIHQIFGYDLMDHKDIRDVQQLENIVQELTPDRILHLAAIARFTDADKDPKLAFETNALGTKNVAMVAGKYHVPVVYASTGSVYMPIKE